MLHIHLLGQLRVFFNNHPLDVAARPKVESLLAYLLLQRNQTLSRDTAAFALWPDVSETDARANLRRHLHALNRALPLPNPPAETWILRDHQTIQWNPQADYWLDVAEFEQQSRTEATLAAAVQLYTGDLLENLYEDWLFYERERLRDLYFALLTRLTAGYRAQRNFAQALHYGQEILRRDPLREDAARQLMIIYQESGNRAGALTTYERFARHLAEELAVEPMPETVDLYQRIKRNLPVTEPQQAPLVIAASTGPKPRELLPFVGHQTELEQLHTAWGRTAQGRGSLVLVGGEAGIGKTRLLNELTKMIDPEEGRVLLGATTFTEPMPYQAIVQALQSALPLVAALDISELWLAALQPILPGLQARRPHLFHAPPLEIDQERDRLFEAMAHCLIGLAQPRPVLLVLEDFHWASASSVLLLEFLARRLAEHPVLLVV
ncbi:MAG: AAA family ATPase [Anaerolineae bacterium]|nr:AAA family ATPase [Anaerolineae bacterium]